MSSFPILSAILFLPLLGAVGCLLLPRMAGWGWALLTALADLALCIVLFARFSSGASGFQFAEHQTWLPGFGVNYALGVDGVNLLLVGLNALLTIVALGASYQFVRSGDRSRQYLVMMMVLSMGMQGVFLATNLFLFYVFWEVMLIPAYLLVGIFGGPRRAYAAIKFVLYTAVGSLLMLVGVIAVGSVVSNTSHTAYDLDYTALIRNGVATLPQHTQIVLFLAFFAAFAVKTGLFPFHSWVADAYSEAPIPVVVLVAGVMAKTGAYGFVRFCMGLFPSASRQLTGFMGVLAVIGILYFALQALAALDFKRLLAYVSISHMSVIILGLFALNTQGIEGGILQMVNHGVIIAGLFLIAGYIEARTGSRRLADFGGLATRLPWLATVFLLVTLSALGLPGLNSFAGEFLAFLGAFRSNVVFGGLATLVVIPAAWYMLRFFQGVMHGEPREVPIAATATADAAGSAGGRTKRGATVALPDLRAGEFAVLLPLLALIIYLGFVPGVLTSRMETTVNQMIPSFAVSHVAPLGEAAPASVGRHLVVNLAPPSRVLKEAGETGSVAQAGEIRWL